MKNSSEPVNFSNSPATTITQPMKIINNKLSLKNSEVFHSNVHGTLNEHTNSLSKQNSSTPGGF